MYGLPVDKPRNGPDWGAFTMQADNVIETHEHNGDFNEW
jgi:hypothetical protein